MNPQPLLMPWQWISLSTFIHFATFGWVLFHCLRNRKEPVSTILWIVVVWSLPFIGFFIYLGFGINRVPRKTWLKEKANARFQDAREAREAETLPLNYWKSVRDSVAGAPPTPHAREIDLALARTNPEHLLLCGNHIEPCITGDEAFPRMLDAIRSARHHIHLQSFIIANDPVGREFMAALAERARAGVQIRLLYDRFGSTFAVLTGLFRRHRRIPNFHIAGWTMARLLKRQFQINLRNHRKALIVDGRVAFLGGINLQAEHTQRDHEPGIRDYHFMVRGPIVHEIQYTFLRDWYYVTDENPDLLLQADHFPEVSTHGPASMRLINGSPSTELDEICDALFTCITLARTSILAVTPYFIPSMDIIRALRIAGLRGINVRIVVPRQNNHVYAGLAGRALYEELLAAGVRIYERDPPFMHAKALLVDDEIAMIGSANLDVRSLRLNYETNLVIYDDAFTNRLKQIMLEELAHSNELDLEHWRRRPLRYKLAENFCHIFKPML
ncbi:MAG TPA: cardiolipin synthase [Kiritimatiellia bacterium]|nr:cardiolipin synthase [Kiritimatiellia bacterium]